jgi:hypothetical protein
MQGLRIVRKAREQHVIHFGNRAGDRMLSHLADLTVPPSACRPLSARACAVVAESCSRLNSRGERPAGKFGSRLVVEPQ